MSATMRCVCVSVCLFVRASLCVCVCMQVYLSIYSFFTTSSLLQLGQGSLKEVAALLPDVPCLCDLNIAHNGETPVGII